MLIIIIIIIIIIITNSFFLLSDMSTSVSKCKSSFKMKSWYLY